MTNSFQKGDIVRFVARKDHAYGELDGMLFEVFECHNSAGVVIDITALAKMDNRWGWSLEDGTDRQGWYINAECVELVTSAGKPKRQRKPRLDAPRRETPLPKEALSPQCQQLLTLLQVKGSVTALEAGGVYRIRALPRRICDLKEAGYKIVRDLAKDTTGQRYARYYLMGQTRFSNADEGAQALAA